MSASFRERVPPLLDSLKQRLDKRQQQCDDGCILYTGQNSGTYGQIEYRRKTYLAHRAAYMVHKGAIPSGVCVCHSCDTPLCINPAHLWLGSYSENVQDMLQKKRSRYNPVRKLSDAQIEEIRAALRQGERQKDIAVRFGVCSSYISMLNTGHRR